jgi:gluconolactonase
MNYSSPNRSTAQQVSHWLATACSKCYRALGLVGLTTTLAAAQAPATQADFFAPTAKVVAVFTGGVGSVCEGPATAPDGRVFFTDIPSPATAGVIWTYTPQTGKTTVFRSPSGNAGGLLFDAAGNLIIVEGASAGGRRLTRTDLKTGLSIPLAESFQGRPFNSPNDATLDTRGRIYFTDPRYSGPESIDQPFMGVYGLDADGTVQLLAANAAKPNGIAVSPDQQTLYVASYEYPHAGVYGDLPAGFSGPVAGVRGDLLAYDLLPSGQVKFRKSLVHFEEQGPDGIKVDADGNIYAIVANSVKVYSSQGTKLAELPIPIKEGFVTNLCFGRGKYSKTLFITAAKTLYMLETKKEGWHILASHH